VTDTPLPRGVKLCAILALVLGTCSGMNATSNALGLLQSGDPISRTAKPPETPEEERVLQAAEAVQLSHSRAVRPFKGARVASALLLSVATMFTLVIALRVLVPAGLNRRRLLRTLSTVTIATAVIRTVDGAMDFVVARKTAKPILELTRARMETDPATANSEEVARMFNDMAGTLAGWIPMATALMTLLVAGAFLGIGQYLRSQRVMGAFPPPSQDLS